MWIGSSRAIHLPSRVYTSPLITTQSITVTITMSNVNDYKNYDADMSWSNIPVIHLPDASLPSPSSSPSSARAAAAAAAAASDVDDAARKTASSIIYATSTYGFFYVMADEDDLPAGQLAKMYDMVCLCCAYCIYMHVFILRRYCSRLIHELKQMSWTFWVFVVVIVWLSLTFFLPVLYREKINVNLFLE